MTDRYKGLVVTLDADYRDDDAQSIINTIKMIKGVATVTPSVVEHADHMNRDRVKRELQAKLLEVLK